MRTTSTVPKVLTELVDCFTKSMPHVEVSDGQVLPPRDVEPLILCIGFSGDPGEPVVENTRTIAQMTTDPKRESYGITCLASSWRGNETDAQKVREEAYAILDGVSEELSKDHTLNGLVMMTRLHTDSFAQAQTNMGAVATVRFVIHVDAMTR